MKEKIEFGDYLALGWNAVPEDMQVDFLSYFKYLLDTNFIELEELFKKELEYKNFPKRDEEQIVEGIIATTLKDLSKKRKDKNYYLCNVLCLMDVIKRIFNSNLYDYLNKENTPQIALHNYEHIMKWFLIDAQELCTLYQNTIKENLEYRTAIDNRYIHYMPVHQLLRQSLFGQVSLNSFADMEISSSISVVRQLIELRIRRAFGVMSYIDNNENLIPLELSLLFESLKKHKEQIEFPVKLENIERIYRWSNLYIHSGKSDLSWIPYYIETLLRPLSFGKTTATGWDVKNGIKTSETVIKEIHKELLEGKQHLKILSCKLECITND